MCNCTKPTTFYNRLFARVYNPFMRQFEERVLKAKRSHLLRNMQGKVLEIGCGTGANFLHYPAGVSVVACDPSLPMLGYAYERLGQSDVKAEIELVHAGIGDETLENYMPEDGFDAIVCTLVLCSIPDQQAAIDTIKKYLKPNGTLHVLEHIRSNSSTGQFFQDVFNPLQKFFADGCHLNRPTDKVLKSNGFQAQEETYFTEGLPFYQAILRI